LSIKRDRTRSFNVGESTMLHRNSTLVFEVFACWPPGPDDALKRQSNSVAGILNDGPIRTTSSMWSTVAGGLP